MPNVVLLEDRVDAFSPVTVSDQHRLDRAQLVTVQTAGDAVVDQVELSVPLQNSATAADTHVMGGEGRKGIWPCKFLTINNKPVCLVPPGTKPTFAVAMVLVASGLASAIAIGGTAGAAAGGVTTATPNLSLRVTQSRSAARQGRHTEAWARLGYRILRNQIRHETGCALHATGLVADCLRAEGCVGLQRLATTVTDEHGNRIAVSVSWARMPTTHSALHFLDLVDLDESGNMTPLPDDISVGVKFTGKHYRSRSQGSIVVVADAAAAGGSPTDAMLDAASDVAVELPWSEG